MDNGRGRMEKIPEEIYDISMKKWPKKSGTFQIGEELEIKGAWFKVKKINPFGIMLKSIPSKPKR
jgi:hypothetical protein